MEQRQRWIKHYCSSHKILLVGEGDFSFSMCLVNAFGSAKNMVATSLNSLGFLMRKYAEASSNLIQLWSKGCMVLHEVDATVMADHYMLSAIKFDRIVFNFPHAGFNNEPQQTQIVRDRRLMKEFFENAKNLITEEGEIHVVHKSYGFLLEWYLEIMAFSSGLSLIEEIPFELDDYPGYHNKYGFGGDNNFNCDGSKTYKFGIQH